VDRSEDPDIHIKDDFHWNLEFEYGAHWSQTESAFHSLSE
jgi:hypothetical protein